MGREGNVRHVYEKEIGDNKDSQGAPALSSLESDSSVPAKTMINLLLRYGSMIV
jgi:hypothetical protein